MVISKMTVCTAYNSALSGLNNAVAQLDSAATGIANPQSSSNAVDDNLATDVVDMSLASFAFQANIVVLRAADQMTGSLLDIKA